MSQKSLLCDPSTAAAFVECMLRLYKNVGHALLALVAGLACQTS